MMCYTEEDLKYILHDIMRGLGVTYASRRDDSRRWSGTDLGTDIAPLLFKRLYGERPPIFCQRCGKQCIGDGLCVECNSR